MKTVRTVVDLRRALEPARGNSTIGLVPTMGAFHDGHVALFRAARGACDLVVASLFVNPVQFGDSADLAAYPRNETSDLQIASDAGVDYMFAPGVDEMYPPDYATWVEAQGAAQGFEGDARRGHFRGVATVCLKLFAIVHPRYAFFGQKDAQQVAVVRQLATDLNLDLEIRVIPTVRDVDGLALSSRNVRLSAEERGRAVAIPRALEAGLAAYRAGLDPVPAARAVLAGVATDYVAVARFSGRPTLVVAARVGATRLIDNVPLDEGQSSREPGIAPASGSRAGGGQP
jgi:pantoate--beta-alanine ligase